MLGNRIAVAAVLCTAALSGTAEAWSPPPPVAVGNGGCPAGYFEIVNYQSTYICGRQAEPDVQIQTTHCPSGYAEVGAGIIGRYVCVKY